MTNIIINQSVAILCDGNNIERSIHKQSGSTNTMINFDRLIPKLLKNRGLNRLIYFKEGRAISSKLAERLYEKYYGSVEPCHKSADIPLSIKATQLASKVDTIIILSGDSDYVELVRHLKGEGVRVEIAAVKENTAQILINEADHFQEITKDDWFMFNRPNYNRNSFKKFNPKKQVGNQQVQTEDKLTVKPTSNKITKIAQIIPVVQELVVGKKVMKKVTRRKSSGASEETTKNTVTKKNISGTSKVNMPVVKKKVVKKKIIKSKDSNKKSLKSTDEKKPKKKSTKK